MTNNEGDKQEPARFKRLGTWTRNSVPVIALAAIALALIPFPEATCQQVCEATLFRKFTVTGFTCLVLGSTLLMYWAARCLCTGARETRAKTYPHSCGLSWHGF